MKSNKKHTLVMFACHIVDDESIKRALLLYDACKKMKYKFAWVSISRSAQNIEKIPQRIKTIADDELENVYHCSVDANSGRVPTILSHVLSAFNDVKNFWFIEYDVCFSGDWTTFFRQFDRSAEDLLTTNISQMSQSSNWWWLQYVDKNELTAGKIWGSLNCIFRISRAGIQSVIKYVAQHSNKIHSQIFIASACIEDQLRISSLSSLCSRRYHFGKTSIFSINEENKLYHAIKLDDYIPDFKKKYFLKICIPAYNAEKTLPALLDSILNQTFKDYAVVICDNGSSDKTYEIACDYARSHSNFFAAKSTVFQNANNARNCAFSYPVKAEYTWFVDADDTLYDSSSLQFIYDVASSNDADCVSIAASMNNEILRFRNSENNIILAAFFLICRTSLTQKFDEVFCKGMNDVVYHFKQLNALYGRCIVELDYPTYAYRGQHVDYSTISSVYALNIIRGIKSIAIKDGLIRRNALHIIDNIAKSYHISKEAYEPNAIVSYKLAGNLGNVLQMVYTTYYYCKKNSIPYDAIIFPKNNIINAARKMFNTITDDMLVEQDFIDSNNLMQLSYNANVYSKYCIFLPYPRCCGYEDIDLFGQLFFNEDEFKRITHNSHINFNNSIGVTVRRGDFCIHPDLGGLKTIECIYDLIDRKYQHGQHIMVFSDDIEWCKQNIVKYNSIEYVEGYKPYESAYLLANCDNIVMSHSTERYLKMYEQNSRHDDIHLLDLMKSATDDINASLSLSQSSFQEIAYILNQYLKLHDLIIR